MVGGTNEHRAACRDILDTFACEIFAMGPNGSGATAKLVVNLVLGLNRLVLAEGLVLGERAGLDTTALLSVLRAGGAYSRVMDTKGEKMLTRDYNAEARLAQHLKDVGLILDLGAQTGTPLVLSAIHEQLLRAAAANGYGDADNAAIIEVLRSMAGGASTNDKSDSQP
ncbi:MAG TPA: NAD(P)-dependent oxidoreductase [Firmicutes bacterium]|nr:NAD(P)-dependent oxidoreductase [Bacillota bacterium]